jgi:hypothetical protein
MTTLLHRFRLVLPIASVSGLLLSGCALNNVGTTSSTPVGAISGILHGGPNPIVGATIKLYATQSNDYGGAGLQLGSSATTDANGSFTFVNATAYTCPAGQYAYVTASGGNTGGAVNPNSLLMAAIGPCANLTTSTQVWIDELTTIAAAYALGNFTTISGTTVNISAPPANNNATPCIANGTTCTATVANGLGHAFATALNLVSSTTGQAYTNPPTNSTNTPALVPAAEINALGNSLQGCVNSTGGSGAAATTTGSAVFSTPTVPTTSAATSFTITPLGGGTETFSGSVSLSYAGGSPVVITIPSGTTLSQVRDLIFPTLYGFTTSASATLSNNVITVSTNQKVVADTLSNTGSSLTDAVSAAHDGPGNTATACGKLFADTTPTGGSVPANTLQAMLNLAKNPSPSGSAVTDIFNIGPPSAYYMPALGNAPPDWALSIIYPKANGGATVANNLLYPWHVALGYDDTVYVMNTNSSSETQSNLLAYKNDGTPLWQSTPDTTTFKAPKWLAADALGHLFMANNTATNAVAEYNESDGSFVQGFASPLSSAAAWGIIVDPKNNVYFSTNATAQTQSIFGLTYGGGTTYTPATCAMAPAAALATYELNFDSSLNLWAEGYTSTTGAVSQAYVLPNTGSVTSPTYCQTAGLVSQTVASGNASYGLSIDLGGVNAYLSNTAGIYKLTPTGSGATLSFTVSSSANPTGGDSPRANFTDGLGSVWTVDNNGTSSSVIQYNPATGTVLGTYFSCAVNGTGCQATSATPNYPAIYGPRNAAADSSGNLWVASSTSGALVEMIGIAAPTWPQVSEVKFGRPK